MALFQRVLVWLLIFPALYSVTEGYGDKIYLKDGTVEESERVWQCRSYVHFILKGTTGVVIRYAKEIVDRVVIDGVEEIVIAEPRPKKPVITGKNSSKEVLEGKETPALKSPPQIKPQTQSKIVDQNIVNKHKGVSFYDPRRKQRYWAANNSRHSSLDGALNALAQIYGQSVLWIETHMGTENDLGVIHRNLMMNQGNALAPNIERTAADPVSDLTKAKLKPAVPTAPERTNGVTSKPVTGAAPKGIEFYNPRRKEKYWTGKDHRYNSLDNALRALAQKYGVTVEWIEHYMGNTNDLNLIHKNIQESLK